MLWGQGSPHRPSAAGCVGRGGATERSELWDKMSRSELSEVCADESQSAGFGEAPQQAFSRVLRSCENGKCVHSCIACYNEFDPERTRKKRVAQRLIPKLQLESNRSYGALLELLRSYWQTVNRSLIAAFDLRRLKHRSNPYIRVTKQAESVMSLSGHRLNNFLLEGSL